MFSRKMIKMTIFVICLLLPLSIYAQVTGEDNATLQICFSGHIKGLEVSSGCSGTGFKPSLEEIHPAVFGNVELDEGKLEKSSLELKIIAETSITNDDSGNVELKFFEINFGDSKIKFDSTTETYEAIGKLSIYQNTNHNFHNGSDNYHQKSLVKSKTIYVVPFYIEELSEGEGFIVTMKLDPPSNPRLNDLLTSNGYSMDKLFPGDLSFTIRKTETASNKDE